MNKGELNKIEKIKDKSNNPKLKQDISEKLNVIKGNKTVLK